MSVYTTQKGKIVVSRYWPDGTRFRRCVPNRTLAKQLSDRIAGAVALGTWVELRRQLTEPPTPPMTIADFAMIYMKEYCEIRNRRPDFKQWTIGPIVRILGDIPVTELRRKHAAHFEQVRSQEVAAPTVNRGLAVLKNLLTFAMTKGLIEVNHLSRYKLLPEPQTVLQVMTLEEERALVAATQEEDFTIGGFVGLLGETGLRKQEGLHVKWENINLKTRMLSVDHTKNGKVRSIPLSDFAVELLGSMTRIIGCPYVFARLDTMERVRDPRSPLERARRSVHLEWVGFHDFRHFRATQWVMRGVDLRTVKELLGHEDFATTMRYAHFTPDHASRLIINAQRAESMELAESPIAATPGN